MHIAPISGHFLLGGIMMAVFRVEKKKDYTVMSNHHLRNTKLSLKAKGLLSLMLSLPENWDYTTKGLATICKDGVDSICSTVKELEDHGYVIRHRIRNSKGQLMTMEYVILEEPRREEPERENPILDNPVLEIPEQDNPTQLNTNKSNTKELNKDQSIDRCEMEEQVKEQISYETLCYDFPKQQVDEIVMLITDTLCSDRLNLHIGQERYPAEVVKTRFCELNIFHITYVFDSLSQTKTEIWDIRSYLLKSLYNAPATMNHYYNAQVKYDLYNKLE